MTRDQQAIWEQEKRVVRALRDGLGKGVDRQAVEVVAALRLVGINTDGSCGGHADRLLGPYVTFRSTTNASDRQQIKRAATPSTLRRRKRRAIQHNAVQLSQVLAYLERFYAHRGVPASQRLICQGFGVIGYRLTAQDADLVTMVREGDRQRFVERQRREFDAFAQFLRTEFFATLSDAPSRAA
ncbi:hypothetical protein [Streptomyces bacillaris]|uniref:hypothetical protein n=1 Tax=Streptomyces bacillaris TaxID=68179 RepID=UPI00382DF49C